MFQVFGACRHFDVKSKEDVADAEKLFNVPDFVGDACKAIASRIRGSVAGVQFDDFHKVIARPSTSNSNFQIVNQRTTIC